MKSIRTPLLTSPPRECQWSIVGSSFSADYGDERPSCVTERPL